MNLRHAMETSVTESHNHFSTLPGSGEVPGTTWGLANGQCSVCSEDIHVTADPIDHA